MFKASDIKSVFSFPRPLIFLLVILVGIIAFFYFYTPDSQNILNSLNKAYKNGRPIESRITKLNYAPYNNTHNINLNEKDLAKRISIEKVSKNPTAQNLHFLTRIYLTQREFNKAIEQIEKAQKLSPQNPEILNDMGVAYLEQSKNEESGGEKIKLVANAIDSFDKALEIKSNLLAAHFNKALSLEVYLPNQAKQKWQEYLSLDSDSEWSSEAKNRWTLLNKQSLQGNSTADELELAFIKAYRQQNDEKAFQIVSQNRELIRKTYLPQRFAMSFVNEEGSERDNKLKTLKYLGGIEKEKMGDLFAWDLANYYANTSQTQISLLKKAQLAVENGYELCLKNKFKLALDKFELAKKLFLAADNTIEAQTISLHFIAYCLSKIDRRKEALELFKQIDNYCSKKNYHWFRLMNLDWLLGNQKFFGYKSITEIRNSYEDALKDAEKIKDAYTTQKFLLSLIRNSNFFRQDNETLIYLHKIFLFSKQPNLSERQKFRSFDKAIPIFALQQFQGFSKEIVLESVTLAEPMKNPLFAINSYVNAGIVHTQTEDFEIAENWFNKAIKRIKDSEEISNQENLADIFLRKGHLEKKRGELQKAAGFYDKSLSILTELKTSALLYETKKSRLLTYQKLGNDEEVEKDLEATIEIAEKHRKDILDEQEKNSYFDNEQDIYDVAIEHKIRQNQNEQAYNFAEISNSRSLLDWMKNGADIFIEGEKIEVVFNESAKPLRLNEIREKIPPKVQILQYVVLENKVLIWLISKEKFILVSSEINSNNLKQEIEVYLKLIKDRNTPKDISQRLYNLLIKPILPHLDKEKQICLVPDKILFHLPFSSLIAPDGKYFLEEFVLFYSPSANVLIVSTEEAKDKARIEDEKLLSVGNPAFDTKEFPGLQRLPEAEFEAEEIMNNYSKESKKLIGEQATKKAFKKIYRNFQVIHFAGHYVVQTESPLLSKLVMAKSSKNQKDNVLTNAELIGEKLTETKLVVLSACDTGIEKYYKGEGLVGLSRTFLSLGVPVVVGSQWKVDSDASDKLMRKFHYYRRQKQFSTDKALRQAQLDMLYSKEENYKSPYFWASFAVFGGYAEY